MREKTFQKLQSVKMTSKSLPYRKVTNYKKFRVLSFLLFLPYLGGTQLFTRQIKVQIGKSTLIILPINGECRLWRQINTSPSSFSFMYRVFSIFRQEKYESNPWKMDIKVVIPVPTHKIITKTKKQDVFP